MEEMEDDLRPVLTQKELARSRIQIALYNGEITPEQAKAKGVVPDEPWGMSELAPDEPPETNSSST